jgi:hypothetical protein
MRHQRGRDFKVYRNTLSSTLSPAVRFPYSLCFRFRGTSEKEIGRGVSPQSTHSLF